MSSTIYGREKMGYITVGNLIKEIRMTKNITRKKLSYGICSEHVLQELEEDRYTADVLMLDIFLQRLGQSPDKFEMILSSELYNMVQQRDLIAEAVYCKKRQLAEWLLLKYPSRTNVDEMFRQRMSASLAYQIDADCSLAVEHLKKAIKRLGDITAKEALEGPLKLSKKFMNIEE